MNSGRTPEDYRRFFAEVLAALDEVPRTVKVKVFGAGLTVDFEEGNPVFRMEGRRSVRADYRRRWLAEHPVPLTLGKSDVFTFVPTTGNRVKVRVR